MLLGRPPKDWDVTTNATPEAIQGLFAHTYYTNEFGTVGVVNDDEGLPESLKVVEVTPYRIEGAYSDARRPDSVQFSQKLDDDLKRRDFTINALAYSASQDRLIDLYGGLKDIGSGVVRAVGDASLRFDEDALRLMRAVRLGAELGFAIEPQTYIAMCDKAGQLAKISKERIRDEFVRLVNSPRPMEALILAKNTGLLAYIAPELLEGVGVEQNQAHSFDVWEHNLRSCQHAADKNWPFVVRLSALLHDIGKPATRRRDHARGDWTFHGHDVVGAKMAKKLLRELKFDRETVEVVSTLVRWHMFFSDPAVVTLSAVRRIIRNVGPEHIQELINLRICDRIGTGRPKEQPFRLRKYQAMIDEALRDPISVGMLKIDGKRLMDVTRETPGPRLGWMLHALLEEVLDDPGKNTEEYLNSRAQALATLPNNELQKLGLEGKERQAEAEAAEIKDIQKKHYVD